MILFLLGLRIRVFQRNRTNRLYRYIEEIYYGSWLTRLWMLRTPLLCAICKLENRKSQWYDSVKSKNLITKSSDVQQQDKMGVRAQKEGANSPFLHLIVLLAPKGLDARQDWGG